jgi:dipeptidyl-peptidase-3
MHVVRFVATIVHELLGHGTRPLLSETETGEFNFNVEDPPLNLLTGRKIESWYRPGETYENVFKDIAQSVEECRAILMSAYLVDDKQLLEIFGYHETSELTADDLVYHSCLYLRVEGIRSLEHYNAESKTRSQAYFGVLKYLLEHGNGILGAHFNAQLSELYVNCDRSKIASDGKLALGG